MSPLRKIAIKTLPRFLVHREDKRIAFYRDFVKATQQCPDNKDMTRIWTSAEGHKVSLTLARKVPRLGIKAERDEIILSDIVNLGHVKGAGKRALQEFMFPLLEEHKMDLLAHAHTKQGEVLFQSLKMEFYDAVEPLYGKEFSMPRRKSERVKSSSTPVHG